MSTTALLPRAPAPPAEARETLAHRVWRDLYARFGGATQFYATSNAIAARLGEDRGAVVNAVAKLRSMDVLTKVKRSVFRWGRGPSSSAPPPKPEEPTPRRHGFGRGRSAARVSRFEAPEIEPERVFDLREDHPAVVEGRTLFPSTVVSPWETPRMLVSGHNNPKLGRAIEKGPWGGMPLYHLTLEERATCPRSCAQWRGCYGSGMHLARRHDAHHPDFLHFLGAELLLKAREHPDGFVVRLHTLGDFFSLDYARFWARAVDTINLRVFGYTAHPPDSEIGAAIAKLTAVAWDAFAIRFSNHRGPEGTVVTMQPIEAPDVIMCPAQTHAAEACATCGLCWADGAPRRKTIGFLKHGMKRGRA